MDEIARQGKHQSRHFALGLAEMLDSVLVGGSRRRRAHDVQLEERLDGLPAAFPDLALDAFYPDAVEVLVIQRAQYVFHVAVERLDSLLLQRLDARPQFGQFLRNLLAARFQFVEIFQTRLDGLDFPFDIVEVTLQPTQVVFELVCLAVEVENLVELVRFEGLDFAFEVLDLRFEVVTPVLQVLDTTLSAVQFTLNL